MVAVRANSTRNAAVERSAAPTVNVAPIAYNLGVSVGWKRFAVSGDVTRVDLVTQPGGRETTDLGISYSGKKASGRVSAIADRPLTNTPALFADPQPRCHRRRPLQERARADRPEPD
jgi:hypothetical protein